MKTIADAYAQPQPDLTGYNPSEKPVVDIDLSACSDEERPRMVHLINTLAKSPKGREALEGAQQNGYKFAFFNGAKTSFGAATVDGRLRLNANVSDDKLIGTMCHECRHAGQFARIKGINDNALDLQSRLMFNRAMEADAQSCAAVACEELKRLGIPGPQREFAEFYPVIHQGFTASLAQNNNVINNQVMTDTFKAWYDQDDIKNTYETSRLLRPMNYDIEQMDYGNDPKMRFDKTLGSKEVVDLMTWTKEGSYFTDSPAVLETGKFVDISSATQKKVKDYFETRQRETGDKPDASFERLPVRGEGVSKPVTAKRIMPSVAKAFQARQGR